MSCSELRVPALIVAYNLFMNVVGRFYRYQSTLSNMHSEWRVLMTVFTFILDESLMNEHAVLSAITPYGATIHDLVDFKMHVISQMVAPCVSCRNVPLTIRTRCEEGGSSMPRPPHHSQNKSSHILLENEKCSVPIILSCAISTIFIFLHALRLCCFFFFCVAYPRLSKLI